jgi:hypothetical protein
MKIPMECTKCKKVCDVDVLSVIKGMIDTAEIKSIYSGFLCEDCMMTLAAELED